MYIGITKLGPDRSTIAHQDSLCTIKYGTVYVSKIRAHEVGYIYIMYALYAHIVQCMYSVYIVDIHDILVINADVLR